MIIEKISAATRLWASVCIRANRIMFGEDKGDVYLIDLENSEHNKIAYPTGTPAGEGGVWTYWYSVATEGDIAIAGQHNGKLYISEDFGATWNDRSPSGGNRNYLAATIKTVGEITTIIVGDNQGIYKSTDLGLTWNRLDPIGDEFSFGKFYSIDADGINYVAADDGDQTWLEGGIYTSTDRGETWVQRYPAGDVRKEWRAVAIDGDYILAGVNGGRLYLSSNKGVSWDEIRPAGNIDANWRSVAITGNIMLAGIDNGRLYLSEDYGETWEEIQPYGDNDKRWLNADGDGGNIVFAPFGGEVWRLYNETELTTISAERSSVYANIKLTGEIVSGGENLTSRGFEYIIQDTEPAEGDSGTEVLEEGEGFDNEEYEIHTGDDLRTLYNLDNDNEDWEATTIWWFRAIGYDNSDNKYYGEWVKNVPEVETGNLNKQLILNSIPTIDAYGNITDKGANEIEQRGFRIIKEYQGDLLGANYYTGINSGYEVMQELEEHSVKDSDGFIIDWYYTVTVYRDILEDSDETGEYNIVLGGGILGDGLIQYLKSNDTYLIQAITDNELGRGFGELKEITTMQGDPLYINVTDIQLSETLFEKTVTFGVTLLNVVRVGIRLGRTIACNELHFFEDGNFGTSGSAKFLVELEPNSTYYIMPYIVVKYGTYEEEIPGMYDWTNPTKKSLYLSKYPPEITDAIEEEEEDDELYSDLADAGANSGNYSYRKIEREITCEKTGNQGLIDYYGRRRSHTVKNHLIQNKTVCCSVACDYVSKFQTLKLKVVIDTPMLIPFEQEDVILLGNGKTLYRNDGIIAFKETGLGNLEEQPYILAKIRKIDPNYISGTESVLTIELEV